MALTTIPASLIDLLDKFVDAIAPCGRFLIDLIRYTAWPVFAGVVFFYLRKPLLGLIDRIKKFSVGSTSFETGSAKQPDAVESTTDIPALTDEEYVRQHAKDISEYLPRMLAQHAFQVIFTAIYGSQMSILQQLYTFPEPQYEEALHSFYVLHRQLAGTNQLSYDNYLGYLQKHNLIERLGTEPKQIKITESGINFIKYIAATYPVGYPFRPY